MNTRYLQATPHLICFDNDFDTDNRAYVPEVWAQETLMVLEENMVMGNLVHRDFEDEIASFGDVVNTRRPGEFTAQRKGANDDVTVQAATADKVQVKLNQLLHTSFLLRDEQMTKSFKDLVTEFLTPAVRSIARAADEILCAQAYQFLANGVGKLGVAASKATVVDANKTMNQNKVPSGMGMRNLVLTPGAEADLLNVAEFTQVNTADDGGNALQNALLGRKFGFDIYMSQNMPSIGSQSTSAAAINLSAGYAAGTTSLAIDGTSATILPGTWFTVAGDMTPQVVVTATGTPTTAITCAPGLKNAVVNDAVVTFYPTGAINYSDGYAAGYADTIAVDGLSAAPTVGQLVSLNSGANRADYGLWGVPTTTALELDNALSVAAANDTIVGLGPSGDFSFAFHPNAIALVTRPLALVPEVTGTMQAVASYNGLSVRVTITYDPYKQGLLVTVDTLIGVKVLDTNLGLVMYS